VDVDIRVGLFLPMIFIAGGKKMPARFLFPGDTHESVITS
jgi:hypothetical protein